MVHTKLSVDSSLTKLGDIYQYCIAVVECFNLEKGDYMLIENKGDITLLKTNGNTQIEVKHHIGNDFLTERDEDFWKTLSNWFKEYDEYKDYSELILFTTSDIKSDCLLHGWNDKSKENRIEVINTISKGYKSDKGFGIYADKIFSDLNWDVKMRGLIDKIRLDICRANYAKILDYVSNKQLRLIESKSMREQCFNDLLGFVISKGRENPLEWKITYDEFNQVLYEKSRSYLGEKFTIPDTFFLDDVSEQDLEKYHENRFVQAILDIEYKKRIRQAQEDYWRTQSTIVNYMMTDQTLGKALQFYRRIVKESMQDIKTACEDEMRFCPIGNIQASHRLYDKAMDKAVLNSPRLEINAPGFQHGVMHDVVEDGEFEWLIRGDESDGNE